MTREHITRAIHELEEAKVSAEFGTTLMLQDEIESLQKLRARFDNINADEEQ